MSNVLSGRHSVFSPMFQVNAALNSIDFDDLMSVVGEIGLFQWLIFLFLSLGILAEAVVVLAYVFVAATPNHHCATPELDAVNNLTKDIRLNLTIPPDDDGSTTYNMVQRNRINYNVMLLMLSLALVVHADGRR